MQTNQQKTQANKILFSRLLHLSRIVVFASLPIALHVDYLEYMKSFFENVGPLGPGDPIPTPSPYPAYVVYIAIVLIIFDLIVLWISLRRNNRYELPTIGLYTIESVLSIMLLRFCYLIFLGVFLLGFLEMLLLGEMKFRASKSSSIVE